MNAHFLCCMQYAPSELYPYAIFSPQAVPHVQEAREVRHGDRQRPPALSVQARGHLGLLPSPQAVEELSQLVQVHSWRN